MVRNKIVRKTLKAARKEKQNAIGGAKIGEGAYGLVYRPPLHCIRPAPEYNSDGYISKVLLQKDMVKEMNASDYLSELDPDETWSIRARHGCIVGLDQENANFKSDKDTQYQVIYKYGGRAFEALMLADDGRVDAESSRDRSSRSSRSSRSRSNRSNRSRSGSEESGSMVRSNVGFIDYLNNSSQWAMLSADGFILIIHLIKGLLPHIKHMNDTMFHCDLHFGNMLYDGTSARLIDFGLFRNKKDRHADVKARWMKEYLDYGVKPGAMPYVMEDLGPLIDAEVENTDLFTVYQGLRLVIDSEWGKTMFKKTFKYWRIDHLVRPRTYEGLYKAIMSLPAKGVD